jgi:hypothetical protein
MEVCENAKKEYIEGKGNESRKTSIKKVCEQHNAIWKKTVRINLKEKSNHIPSR